MPARMSTFLAELATKLAPLFDPSRKLTVGFGSSNIAHHDAPPRIVWVPIDGRFASAEKSQKNPKAYLTRVPMIAAHCWGETYDATEELVHRLLGVIHLASHGSYELGGESWPLDDDGHHGTLAIVTFGIKVPVVGPTLGTVKPTTYQRDTTGSAQGDGYLDWGET